MPSNWTDNPEPLHRATTPAYILTPKYSTTLKDLDTRYFLENYVPRAIAPDVLASNDRTELDRLMACRMISVDGTHTPTVLGLLVCGRNPRAYIGGAYVQFLRIAGTDLADPIVDAEVIDGKVEHMYAQTISKLKAYRQVAVEILEEVGERRTESVPLVALQQLVANAIMHRSYEGTNAPIRITWYTDRIDIFSPGGPFGTVNEENFGQPNFSDYRNLELAESMRVLGIVQRFGVGIRLAQTAMAEAGLDPIVFEVSRAHVRATLRLRRG